MLVILGLLVGGVLAGQSLIRASELRSITSEQSKYVAAIHSFRDKYFALPGDMPNATQFWGAVNAVASTCMSTPSSTSLTCNGDGDGDGIIQNACFSLPPNGRCEPPLFWKHLANAGLIEGSYDGLNGSSRGRLKGGYWTSYSLGTLSGTPGSDVFFDGEYINSLIFSAAYSNEVLVTPQEMWNIDKKVDDGKPAYGKLVAAGDSGASATGLDTCTTTGDNTNLAAEYLLSSSDKGCYPIFRQQF